MTRPAIRIERLSKCYRLGETHEHTLSDRLMRAGGRLLGRAPPHRRAPEEFWALRDIDLTINEGEAVGIVGSNGAGKSTLLKILSRITPPTSGRALVRGRLSSLLEVGTGFHPELTGRENVFLNGAILGMRRAEVARKFDEIVAFAGVEQFIDTPVKRYSSGMYVRLAFAVAAHLEPDVLIIDEVLAVGDAEFQKRCLGKMGDVARQGRTVIFVSHNMAAVQKLCSRAAWISAGRIAHVGTPAEAIGAYLEGARKALGQPDCDPEGLLYRDPSSPPPGESTRVVGLELLDEQGQVIREARTWQRVVFRITFDAASAYRAFSAVLQIATPDGLVLVLTSTTPDRSMAFSVSRGRYTVDCRFEQLPLAAGEYLLGLGLAIPGVEYVWRDESLARLHVVPNDIYRSGLPPAANRYLLASAHEWQSPVALDAGRLQAQASA